MRKSWLLAALVLIVIGVGLLAFKALTPTLTEREEVFELYVGENKHIIIDETEVVITYVATTSRVNAEIMYSINDTVTTTVFEVGDAVLELPKGKIVLEHIADYIPVALFRVSGNFQIKGG